MYTPIDSDVFAASYAGALSGLSTSGKLPLATRPSDRLRIAKVAEAFAVQFDIVWATFAVPINETVFVAIGLACEGTWQERPANPTGLAALNPLTYNTLCIGIAAQIVDANAF